MFSPTASDSEEDEGCYVFWETPSILPPAPRAPSHAAAAAKTRSQRSDEAPSPSLGPHHAQPNGTPKGPKRTSSAATLPSPSGSTLSIPSARPVPALRQKKKRRNGTGGQEQPASQPLDARTLRMVSQLAMKVNAREAGVKSPAVARGTGRTAVGDGKGKGRDGLEVTERTSREPLRPSLNRPADSPLRRPSSRSPQTLLTASSTSSKPSLTKPSPLSATSSKPLSASSSSALRPPLLRGPSASTTVVDEDEDSYFDADDDSFELALSQLDPDSLPLPPAPLKAAAPPSRAPPAARLAAPSVPLRSSPRLARQAAGGGSSASRQAAPPPSRPAALPACRPAPLASRPTSLAPSSRSSDLSRLSRPVPPKPVPAKPTSAAPSPPAPRPALVLRTHSHPSSSQQERRELEALAKRELEALAADGGLGGWSDDEF
ncbi:hypothetical protein JCM8097_008414 [Rhodosporidiobolus ruineniae]